MYGRWIVLENVDESNKINNIGFFCFFSYAKYLTDNIKFVLAVRSSGLTFYTTICSLLVLMAMKQYKMAHDESATKK
uniref:Uncharacterized protein n=1 Tax=Glossina palpalis gambiensis TaxID=67801 RepID=A0A1B0BZZ7_9MUSC